MAEKKIQQLKKLLNELGISQREFASRYYTEKVSFGNDIDEEEKLFYDTFRKQLSRSSQNSHTIDSYISFLKTTSEFKKSQHIYPNYIKYDDETELLGKIKEYSRDLFH